MTDEELFEIEKRSSCGTKGPWIPMIEGITHTSGSDFIMTGICDAENVHDIQRGDDLYLIGGLKDDLIFIANAKQDIPKLIEEIKKLKSILKKASC